MKLLNSVLLAAVLAAPLASAQSFGLFSRLKVSDQGNKVTIMENDSDPGDDPFPPVEELEPVRMGSWKAKVQKQTVTYENGEWSARVEDVCMGTADAGVYDATGKEYYTINTPQSTWITCSLTYNNQAFSINLLPFVLFGDAKDPFSGNVIQLKSYSAYWGFNGNIPPRDFFDNFRLAENFYTKDTHLTNAMFAVSNAEFALCEGEGETRPQPGPKSDDNSCSPPEDGSVFEFFVVFAEINDPMGGRQ